MLPSPSSIPDPTLTETELPRISSRAALLFASAFIGLLLSKGLALTPGFAMDDYNILHVDRLPLFSVGQGRFSQAVLQNVLTSLGTSATSVMFFSVFLFFIGAAWTIAVGVLYATRRRGSLAVQCAAAAIVGAHPYLTEYFSFRESLITQGTSFLLLGLAFTWVLCAEAEGRGWWGIRSIATIGACLVVIAGAQQTAFLMGVYFVLTRLAIDWIASDTRARVAHALHINRSMIVVVACSAVAYVVVYAITRNMTGAIPDERASLLLLSDVPARLSSLATLVDTSLFKKEPVLSAQVKWLILSVMILTIAAIGRRRPRAAIGTTILLLTLTLLSFALLAVSKVWWPVPRALYGIAFAYGLTIVCASIFVTRGRQWIAGLSGLAAIGLCLHSNAMLHDQWRLNRWDAWTAHEIVSEVLQRQLPMSTTIVLVRAPWYFPAGLKTIEGDLNVSAVSAGWAVSDVLRETTGREWSVRGEAAMIPICAQSSDWPAPGAIHQIGTDLVFCMGR